MPHPPLPQPADQHRAPLPPPATGRWRRIATGMAAVLALGLPAPFVGVPLAAAAPAVATGAVSAAGVSAAAEAPTVTGPVTGGTRGYPFFSFAQQPSPVDLAAYGYVEEEFFLEGRASSYDVAPAGLAADGRWAVQPGTQADYRTRLLVIRPARARDFNGTALVEWNNVTASYELFPDFALGHEELLRQGYAYVSVSAQYLGIAEPYGVKTFDPVRYAPLVHPGDTYSYDIFTQAGEAVRGLAKGVKPLRSLTPKRVIADGESQSAGRLVTYINAVQPLERVYDAFMVHSRSAAAAPINQQHPFDRTTGTTPVPSPSLIRDDQPEPVLQFEAETDVVGFAPARQLAAQRVRTWEVAGTAHVDRFWATETSFRNIPRDLPASYRRSVCILPINEGPQNFVFNSALRALDRWTRGRAAPSNSPVIAVANGDVVRDRYGIAVGGVRTPAVDAPTKLLSGTGNFGDPFCRLYGTTLPFSDSALAELYPTASAYLDRVRRSANDAQRLGFLLPRDAATIRAQAAEDLPVG